MSDHLETARTSLAVDLALLPEGLVPQSRALMLARHPKGGYVYVAVTAVHRHECNHWRFGKRNAPCTCGALETWAKLFGESAETAP